MDSLQKVALLREEIYSSLTKLVGNKCILLDAPYYHNIGDVLIWTGVQCLGKLFLKKDLVVHVCLIYVRLVKPSCRKLLWIIQRRY